MFLFCCLMVAQSRSRADSQKSHPKTRLRSDRSHGNNRWSLSLKKFLNSSGIKDGQIRMLAWFRRGRSASERRVGTETKKAKVAGVTCRELRPHL